MGRPAGIAIANRATGDNLNEDQELDTPTPRTSTLAKARKRSGSWVQRNKKTRVELMFDAGY